MAQSQQFHSQSKPLHNQETNRQQNQQSPEIDDVDEEESFSYAMQLATSTAISMAMQTAAEMGVFDFIHRTGHEARLSAAKITAKLSCNNSDAPSALDHLLRLLASHAFLSCSVVVDEDRGRGVSNDWTASLQWLNSL